MAATNGTFRNLKRLHCWFAVSALALLAATVWMVAADHNREWKHYQRTFRDEIEPSVTGAPLRQGRRPLAIEQIWLPDLTIDYHFAQVARFDRCTTCHLGIDKTSDLELRRGLPQPYSPHPRLDLFVGPSSPHPMAEFGCTVCHDGQGSATQFKFASHSPDDAAQRAQWREAHGWFRNPDWGLPMRPKRFAESNCLLCHREVSDLEPSRRFPDPPAPKLVAGYHLVRQNGCFGCHEIKEMNAMPKVGPSLRSVADKLDRAMLRTWIAEPAAFRPDTRMPRFFGLHEHLDQQGLDEARRFEPVEVRAIAEYLLAVSRKVAPLAAPAEAAGSPSADRGKRLFRTQGCLACHRHADFPQGQATQGPDLSRVGAKLSTPAGRTWLESWIRDPARHSPRTLMPNPLLSTDPAADNAAYLAGSTGDWKPKPLGPVSESDLDALALLYLSRTVPAEEAEEYLRHGIPASKTREAGHDAAELVGPIDLRKKLLYVGRQTIGKRGCHGCHEIPGFEDAQPIGPALSDWGRKPEALLAFERVERFLDESSSRQPSPKERESGESEADRAFYLDAIRGKRREGFLWQKLRAPRSFDFANTAERGYNGQLLMGRFALSAAQREAVMTFVLGLEAEPPKEKYLPRPDARTKVIVEGRKVLDKYACAGCHTLQMERWTVQWEPAEAPTPPPEAAEYPWVKPQIAPEQLAASQQTDARGRCRAELVGMPQWNADEQQYAFTLWEPAAIAGKIWPVGGAEVLIAPGQIVKKRGPLGGEFARLLYPAAVAEAKDAGAVPGPQEAWGWVPPPLVHTGRAVQPAWLHDYLLEPSEIRPAALLRMPKYNLSPAEAAKLADYFAAAAGAEFPFDSDSRGRNARLATTRPEQPEMWEKALRLVADPKTFCAKCHSVGDYSPGGQLRSSLAPNLERVAGRIRPEHLRRWIASPKSILPYAVMPVIFPVDQTVGQDLLPGTSPQQLDAVVDLLLNYDAAMIRKLKAESGKRRSERGKRNADG